MNDLIEYMDTRISLAHYARSHHYALGITVLNMLMHRQAIRAARRAAWSCVRPISQVAERYTGRIVHRSTGGY